MSEELKEALESIEVIRGLEDNWNNNGAKQFSEKLINKAINLVKELTPTPEVFPTACNSIQLEWESEGAYVELEVFEDRIKMYTTALDRL